MSSSTEDYIVRKATYSKTGQTTFNNNINSSNRRSQKQLFSKNSYQTGRCVGFTGAGSYVGAHGNASDYVWVYPRTTIPSHYRICRGITLSTARHPKAAQSISRPRETWLHPPHPLHPMRTHKISRVQSWTNPHRPATAHQYRLWVIQVTLRLIWQILITDLVIGKPRNRWSLWAPTNKWATGIGHTDTCMRLSTLPDVAACVAVTVSWRLVAVPR
jgi:hypothetical protein